MERKAKFGALWEILGCQMKPQIGPLIGLENFSEKQRLG